MSRYVILPASLVAAFSHMRRELITAAAIVLAVPAFAVAQPRLLPHATHLVPSCGSAHSCIWKVACDQRSFNKCVRNCMAINSTVVDNQRQCNALCSVRSGGCR